MFSEFDYNEITNSPTDAKTFGRANIYHLQLINETAFEIVVLERNAGEIRVPAGITREFKGHPNFPSPIDFKVRFNAAAAPTDFLTIITTQSNGKRLKQC
jgi:hypothetical protein